MLGTTKIRFEYLEIFIKPPKIQIYRYITFVPINRYKYSGTSKACLAILERLWRPTSSEVVSEL